MFIIIPIPKKPFKCLPIIIEIFGNPPTLDWCDRWGGKQSSGKSDFHTKLSENVHNTFLEHIVEIFGPNFQKMFKILLWNKTSLSQNIPKTGKHWFHYCYSGSFKQQAVAENSQYAFQMFYGNLFCCISAMIFKWFTE